MLCTMRYIHRNPFHHDGRTLTDEFPWSSYHEYVSGEDGLVSKDEALDVLGGVEGFSAFHEMPDDARYLDINSIGAPSDDEARAMSDRCLGLAGVSTSIARIRGELPRAERDKALRTVLALGLSYRQVQRISGVNYTAVRNVGLSLQELL